MGNLFKKVVSIFIIFLFVFTDVTFYKKSFDELSLYIKRNSSNNDIELKNFAKIGALFYFISSEIFSPSLAYGNNPSGLVCYRPNGPIRSIPLFNPQTGYCETWPLNEHNECPERYVYSQWLKTCVDSPTCEGNSVYNPNTKRCEGYGSGPGGGPPTPPELTLESESCVVDKNNNDEIEENEVVECLSATPVSGGGQSKICPLDMRDCIENYGSAICPSGYSFNTTYQKCTKLPSCPSGYSYNNSYDTCVGSVPDCPSGYTFNFSHQTCTSNPTCISGTWNSAIKYCSSSPVEYCPPGMTSAGNGKCKANFECNIQNFTTRDVMGGLCTSTVNPSVNPYINGVYEMVLYRPADAPGFLHHNSIWSKPPTYDQIRGFVNTALRHHLFGNPANGLYERNPCSMYNPSYRCTQEEQADVIAAYVWYLGRCPDWIGYDHYCGSTYRWSEMGSNAYQRLGEFQKGASPSSSGECGNCPYYPYTSGYPACGKCPKITPLDTCVCAKFTSVGSPPVPYCEIMSFRSSSGYCAVSGNCVRGSLEYIGGGYYCTEYASYSCPSGGTYNSSLHLCLHTPSCNYGGSFNQTIGLCLGSHSCPSGGRYSSSVQRCINSPDCANNLNKTTDLCEQSASCPSGGQLQPDGRCFMGYSCPYGSNYQCMRVNIGGTNSIKCSKSQCTTGASAESEDTPPQGLTDDGPQSPDGECLGQIYIFNGKSARCRKSGLQTGFKNCCKPGQKALADSTGSIGTVFSIVKHGGEALYHAYHAVRLASMFAQGNTFVIATEKTYMLYNQAMGWYEVSKSTTVGMGVANAIGQNGGSFTFAETVDGNPVLQAVGSDQLSANIAKAYLDVAGRAVTMAIVHLAISGLIKDKQLAALANLAASAYFYSIGWIGPLGFGFAVLSTIMSILFAGCDQQDVITNNERDSGRCHEIGEKCIKKILFIGCVQKAKIYCCFNSKLARIVHEQGRPQLTTDISNWGSPGSPNCRGFTPEEFAALDFDKIDLSEYINDIVDKVQTNVEDLMRNYFQGSIHETISR
ncbi:MAG: conjugal transfer protein TraN [Candidatus Micrarchaeia archaeon]